MGRTGLYSQFGLTFEDVFGTYKVPTRFLPIVEEGFEDAFERIVSESLIAGVVVDDFWAENRKGVEGPVTFEVFNKGFGIVFKMLLGAIATSQPAAVSDPTVYEHLATVAALDGQSVCAQAGIPDGAGTVNPFTLLGGKVTEWEMSLEVDGLLRLSVTFDGVKLVTSNALAVASYPTGLKPIPFDGATLDIGGTALKVRSFTLSGSNGLKTDRHVLGQQEKLEQIGDTERRSFELELPSDFDPGMGAGMAAYEAFKSGAEAAFNAKFLGDVISNAYRSGVEVTAPRVRRDGGTPTVGGPDLVEQTQTLKVLQPAAGSPLSILYRTTDPTP